MGLSIEIVSSFNPVHCFAIESSSNRNLVVWLPQEPGARSAPKVAYTLQPHAAILLRRFLKNGTAMICCLEAVNASLPAVMLECQPLQQFWALKFKGSSNEDSSSSALAVYVSADQAARLADFLLQHC